MKRLSLTFLFIAIFSYLFSNFYLPKYYLDDFKPVENNSVDIYSKYAKNLTLFKENFCFLNKLNIQKKVEPDYETRYIKISYQIRNKYDLIHPVFLTEQEYANGLFKSKFKSLLKSTFKEYLEQKNRDTGGGLIKDIVLKIPKYAMPKAVEKFLGGNEAARLRLNGSQDITFSGKDTKTKNKSYNEGLANRNFSLKMHQNLDLNLHGTIGKKIFVNVSHKTASDMQQGKDNVDIHYQGLEDEIVKFVKAGDMDKAGGQTFSSAGNSISSSGLFGVRADFQLGDVG